MDMSQFYQGEFLKAVDLVGRTVHLTIAKVTEQEFSDGQRSKPAIYFEGKEKGLILNKTNCDVLMAAYGRDSSGWIGKELILGTHKVRNPAGQVVDGFKVAVPSTVEMNDDVPF